MPPKTDMTVERFTELLENPVEFAKWQQEQITEAIGPAIGTALGDALKQMGVKRLPMGGGDHNPDAAGADLDGQFGKMGGFLRAIGKYALEHEKDTRLKVLQEGEGSTGGFLVPEEFRTDMLRLAIEQSLIRPRARVIPMARESMLLPIIKDTTHASNIYGGVTANWNAEGADLSSDASEPTFGQARWTAHKLTGYTVAGNELLADSAIALTALLMSMFPEALAYFEDLAFISGTGSGQPEGFLTSAAQIEVPKVTGQDAATVVTENLDAMFARMLPGSHPRAVWIANIDVIPELLNLVRNAGTGGGPVFVSNVTEAPVFTIYGRPVHFTEKVPTLGTLGDINFVDLSYYIIGDRQALSMAASEHVKFTEDQMVWKFTQRVDGKVWLKSALTPRNGTKTLSPIVSLATRA